MSVYYSRLVARAPERPSDLTLDGQMSLESVVGFSVVEDLLKRRILERSTVNITGDPVIVEYRSTLVI